jgi:hypothetical protein
MHVPEHILTCYRGSVELTQTSKVKWCVGYLEIQIINFGPASSDKRAD